MSLIKSKQTNWGHLQLFTHNMLVPWKTITEDTFSQILIDGAPERNLIVVAFPNAADLFIHSLAL